MTLFRRSVARVLPALAACLLAVTPAAEAAVTTTPEVPSDLATDMAPCASGPARPLINNPTPTLSAVARDADGGNISVEFEWWTLDGALIGQQVTAQLGSGTRFSVLVQPQLPDGGTFAWRARAHDDTSASGWSGWCEFSLDSTGPQGPPTVTSSSFPEYDFGAELGVRGEFTFGPNGATDVTGYDYGFSENAPWHVGAGPDGTATVPITIWEFRSHDLYVYAVDAAGNRSWDYYAYNFIPSESERTPSGVYGDHNGEGLADILGVQAAGQRHTRFLTLTSNGAGFYPPVRTWDSGPNTGFAVDRIRHVRGDFDGDGLTDVAVLRDEGGSRTTAWIFRSQGNGYVAPAGPAWDSGPGAWSALDGKVVAGDFNGDGRDDLGVLQRYPDAPVKLWLFYGSATGLSSPLLVWDSGATGLDWAHVALFAGDVNGDGLSDVGALYRNSDTRTTMWIAYGTSAGVAAPIAVWDSGPGKWSWDDTKPVAGDVNGDGRTDVAAFYRERSGRTALWLFNGSPGGVGAPVEVWNSDRQSVDWSQVKPIAGDYDGDGLADVGAFYGLPGGQASLSVFHGTPSGVAPPEQQWRGTLDWATIAVQ